MTELAEGLKKHLDEKGIEGQIALAGISMGGYWAMEFTRQFPKQIKKTLFVSTRHGVDSQDVRANRLKMAEQVLQEGTSYLPGSMIPGLLGKTTRESKPNVVKRLKNMILSASPEAIALAQRTMAARQDQSAVLRDLKQLWIIAGKEDSLIPPAEASAMAEISHGSKLQLLESVGHLVPMEDPDGFQRLLEPFLLNPAKAFWGPVNHASRA